MSETAGTGTQADPHHDWVQSTLGVDPRGYQAAAPEEAPGGFFSSIGNALGDAASAVGNAASSAAHAVEGAAETVVSTVADAGAAVVSGVETAAGEVAQAAGTVVHEAGAVLDTVADAGKAAAETVVGKLGEAAHAVGEAASAAGRAIEGAAEAVGHAVSGVVGGVEDWFDAGPKAADVKATADKVTALSDADLDKMPAADKAAMVKELLKNGTPTAAAREAQRRVYRHMTLDADFMKQDEARGQQIADDLKGDKDLEDARDNWGKKSSDQKIAALKKVVEAQSKRMGIPPPEIETFDDPKSKTDGYFASSDGKLHFNVSNADFQNFRETVDTAIHENAHNYQHHLVDDLHSGKLKPGDPAYAQATMFEVNEMEHGYVPPKEDYDTYRKQPMENHSWSTGPDTTSKILKTL